MKKKKTNGATDRPPVVLPVLGTVKDSQSQFGLRHDDYTRYRQYCCRRLRRIRKSVRFLHGRIHFKKKKLEAKHVKNERFLSIPLLNAERAWSYAMELKNDLAKDDDSRKQHHLLKRLKRAVKWSKMLQELSDDVADVRTQIESEIYATWMAGNEHIEQSRWREALISHIRSKALCEELAKHSSIEDEERCTDMVKQLAQSIRLCKYNAKRVLAEGETVASLVAQSSALEEPIQAKFQVIAKQHQATAATSSTTIITWNERRIPVSNAKLQAALQAARDKENEIKSSEAEAKVQLLTEAIAHYTTAFSLNQVDLYANEGAKLRTVQLDKKAEYLKLLRSYLDFQKLKHRFSRNQIQAQALAKVYENENAKGVILRGKAKKERLQEASLIAAYERLLDNAHRLGEFAKDASDAGREKELEGFFLVYRGLRCFYKAAEYEGNRKHLEAHALYRRCEAIVDEAKGAGASEEVLSQLGFAVEALPGRLLRTQALVIMAKENKEKSGLSKDVEKLSISKQHVPLLDRLSSFHSESDQNLIEFPVGFQSAPGKPLFFDVAYHSLQFDSLASRIEEEKKKDGSGGLLSNLGLGGLFS